MLIYYFFAFVQATALLKLAAVNLPAPSPRSSGSATPPLSSSPTPATSTPPATPPTPKHRPPSTLLTSPSLTQPIAQETPSSTSSFQSASPTDSFASKNTKKFLRLSRLPAPPPPPSDSTTQLCTNNQTNIDSGNPPPSVNVGKNEGTSTSSTQLDNHTTFPPEQVKCSENVANAPPDSLVQKQPHATESPPAAVPDDAMSAALENPKKEHMPEENAIKEPIPETEQSKSTVASPEDVSKVVAKTIASPVSEDTTKQSTTQAITPCAQQEQLKQVEPATNIETDIAKTVDSTPFTFSSAPEPAQKQSDDSPLASVDTGHQPQNLTDNVTLPNENDTLAQHETVLVATNSESSIPSSFMQTKTVAPTAIVDADSEATVTALLDALDSLMQEDGNFRIF